MRYASRKAALINALDAMRFAIGGAGGVLAMLAAVAALLSLAWFSDALYRIGFADHPAWWGLMPFLLVLAVLSWLTLRRSGRLPDVDVRERQAGAARAMVMFLSPTRMPEHAPLPDALPEREPWEMPLVAVRHHWRRGRLEWVHVIPSADAGGKDDGTWRQLARFRHFIARFADMPPERIVVADEDAHGVNFESAEELYAAIRRALESLETQGVAREDIVIDITGGQKMPAVVGGIAGLGEGLRIQYVSTRDKRPLEYDITMRLSA